MKFYEGFWPSGKKARRARTKAQLERSARTPAMPVQADGPTMKMSDALVALTRPLFKEGPFDPRDAEDRKMAFELAQMAWNMEVMDKDGGEPRTLNERMMALVERFLPRKSSRWAEALLLLRQRKREMFPNDDRLVMGVEAYITEEGDMRVTAASVPPGQTSA